MVQIPDSTFNYITLVGSVVFGFISTKEYAKRSTVTTGNSSTSQGFISIVFPPKYSNSKEEEDLIRAYHSLVPKRTIEEEEAEEQEWHTIVNKPHVRQALRRIADETRQQISAGETEEGGFAVE